MTTDELFDAFGGREAVMEITGAARNAMNHWLRAGVPFKHWKPLIIAAQQRGISGITLDSLESTRQKVAA